LIWFSGEDIPSLEPNGRPMLDALAFFTIALLCIASGLGIPSDIGGRILTWWVAGKLKIKDSEAYPLA
jgi:hypothetical protein